MEIVKREVPAYGFPFMSCPDNSRTGTGGCFRSFSLSCSNDVVITCMSVDRVKLILPFT